VERSRGVRGREWVLRCDRCSLVMGLWIWVFIFLGWNCDMIYHRP
jgi:hypothetical protein